MPRKLLQINIDLNIPVAEFSQGFPHAADAIAQQPGLVWKIWLVDEAVNGAGGWYLFESEGHARAYLEGELVQALRGNPAVGRVTARLFDPDHAATAVTRGMPALDAGQGGA